MNEIIIVLLMISVWACHRGLTNLANYLLDKIALFSIGALMLFGIGNSIVRSIR